MSCNLEASLPFPLLGLDSDNGGEFLNCHVLRGLQQRRRPVFMTRSRPNKKDDNAHVEQKSWTHVRQHFGYARHENPEVGPLLNTLGKEPYGQLLNHFHASFKLDHKKVDRGRIQRVYGPPLTRGPGCWPATKSVCRTNDACARKRRARIPSPCGGWSSAA